MSGRVRSPDEAGCGALLKGQQSAGQVMGMMQGKTVGDTFVVLDAFALPVEGTETRVNAAAEANEYMVAFVEASQHVRCACPPPAALPAARPPALPP